MKQNKTTQHIYLQRLLTPWFLRCGRFKSKVQSTFESLLENLLYKKNLNNSFFCLTCPVLLELDIVVLGWQHSSVTCLTQFVCVVCFLNTHLLWSITSSSSSLSDAPSDTEETPPTPPPPSQSGRKIPSKGGKKERKRCSFSKCALCVCVCV